MSQRAPQVLLVDDNPADVALVCEASAGGRYGSKIRREPDGERALTYLSRVACDAAASLPDLILLDLKLPGKDGREVLRELKSDARFRRIPVVIFSTSEYERDISSCYEAGANGYVCKPLNLDCFFDAIRSIEEFWFGCARLTERRNDGIACERTAD